MASKPPDRLRPGDIVRLGEHEYVVKSTTREGKVRLLGTREGVPPVNRLVAPTRVTLIAPVPRLPSARRPATDPARITAVGVLLRQAREGMGFTTRRLADAIGVSSTYLSRAELGTHHSVPSASYLERFAALTGADEDLLCATAGIVPRWIASQLTDVDKLRSVRLLLQKLEGLDHHGQTPA